MSNRNTRIAIGLIVGILLIAALCLCPKPPVEVRSGPRIVMGTFARVIAVAPRSHTAKNCIDAAFEQLDTVDKLMSVHRDDSQISRVNRDAHKSPVSVDKLTFDVLQKAVEFSKLTDGTFDITVGPLIDIWHCAAEANSVPSDVQLRQARRQVGYEKLILDANDMTVRFAVEGMKLDLGGIAKGYAIERAVQAMQAGGAVGGMVDVGGDIRCFGTPAPPKKTWLIGLQDPTDPQRLVASGKILLTLTLTNTAIATSGDYRRFILIDGRKYSHIVDRNTGKSAGSLSSVTIIADNATDADALATAVSVMGPDKGLALIEKIPRTEAILISPSPQYHITQTSGAHKYLR